jgi:DNA-binding protein HU-beta
MATTKRTTHKSSTGKKLYAVRSKTGEFKDIQSYKKAHGQDVKRKSKAETAAKKTTAKKSVKKKTAKKASKAKKK